MSGITINSEASLKALKYLSNKNKTIKSIRGQIVDVINNTIYRCEIRIKKGFIDTVMETDIKSDIFIVPAFVDAHVHIESSMLVPSKFARAALTHGVIATVSDPHEIANVMGMEGIRYMIDEPKKLPFRFYFGAPSCVPATLFDTSGAIIGVKEIDVLLQQKDIYFLSEMMNFPGVINKDPQVMAKIALAKKYGKNIDGHAPSLRGEKLDRYIKVGINTEHETIDIEEGREKLQKGMKLLIREGSAAKNLEELSPLIKEFPDMCMFCSDDIHPDDLIKTYIDDMIRRLLKKGFDPITVLKCASLNAAKHYGIDMGFLQKGNRADFVIVDNLTDFNILCTVIDGKIVATGKKCFLPRQEVPIINKFHATEKSPDDFKVFAESSIINVIEAIDGQIYTKRLSAKAKIVKGQVVSDIKKDILKIALVNRYEDKLPVVGFTKNFGLKKGAIATSVAHDSHNILCVGVKDTDIASAVNAVINYKGGLAVHCDGREEILELPVAGIMSDKDCSYVANKYLTLTNMAKELGCNLNAPFITLSFIALIVIPELKISEKGLFDVISFSPIKLFQ